MSSINRRDFVKSTLLSSALPVKAIALTKSGGYRSPNQAERGIKVACSTVLWRYGAHASLSGALKGIAQAGYEWAEGSADELLSYEDRADELKALLGGLGLGWVTAMLTANLLDQKEGVRHIGRAVRTARLLQAMDADFLIIKGDWGGVLRDPRSFQLVSKRLVEIGARVFEETGLYCAYHFQEKDRTQVQKLIAISDSRYVKFCLDTLSLIQLGIDSPPIIRAYAGRVIHVHLHDAIEKNERWRDVVLGQGGLKVADILEALCEARYDGWVTVEQGATQRSPVRDAAGSRNEVQRNLTRMEQKGAQSSSFKANQLLTQQAGVGASRFDLKRAALRYFVAWGATTLMEPANFSQTPPFQVPVHQRAPAVAEATQAMHRHTKHSTVPLPPRDPNFKPLFFAEDEYRDLSALVDAIIPASETPGALEARADEFLDLIIWSKQKEHDAVKVEVDRFRSLCLKRHGRAFRKLSSPQKDAFLTYVTGAALPTDERPAADFFYRVRELTLHAYYTGSPQGLIQELGYRGNAYVTEFKGCTHPEHKG
jgi:sugar phosphate isomerase/epimerase